MKFFSMILFFVGGLVIAQPQQLPEDSVNAINRALILKFGLNLVDSTGDKSPFNIFSDFDEMAFSNNFNIELEYRFSKLVSFAGILNTNKWKANKGNIDGIMITEDYNYLSIDLDLKYYYGEALGWSDQNDWLELYLHGGVGIAKQAGNSGASLNFGPGANFWFSNKLGLNINGTGKWLLNHGDNLYSSNHFQYSVALMYRFVEHDNDNDGVRNKIDECPNTPGIKENNGCPEIIQIIEVDSDGDFVFDSVDDCPKIKGSATNNGCPLPDSDNDGITDAADECPNTPGIESNNGCPYKTSTPKIPIEDRNTDLNSLSRKILFDSGNYNFRQEAYPVLLEMVRIIKQFPDSVFKIEGHTDSAGSYETNRRLSQTRINSVRNYLIDCGIPVENIITEAFGETRPIASNLLKEGRELNRRVEIIRIE